MTETRCDGLWRGADGAACASEVVVYCACRRCARESGVERFGACADPAHEQRAAERHLRVRGDRACWTHRVWVKEN